MSLAWFPGFFGVDQTETRHPEPHSATPHRCPELVGVAVHPSSSTSLRAPSTSFLGWRALIMMLTEYNDMLQNVNMLIQFADPDFEANFRAYVNYLEDLAGVIAGQYGMNESLVEGVHAGVLLHPPVQRIRSRDLSVKSREALEACLRKSWGDLRRMHREIEDPDLYEEEANAWLPVQAYYGVYSAVLAVALASAGTMPRNHAGALRLIADRVKRGLLPFPWSAYCDGCPQTGSHMFGGLRPTGVDVHVLSSPDPSTSDDRLAMFLRTTRARELKRRFDDARGRPAPGRTRRNIRASRKEEIASGLAATTVFDLFWRMRKKANYGDPDVFVLGAADVLDARRFANALVIVTDATVAALEAIVGAHIGPRTMAEIAQSCQAKARLDSGQVLERRVAAWSSRVTAQAHQLPSR